MKTFWTREVGMAVKLCDVHLTPLIVHLKFSTCTIWLHTFHYNFLKTRQFSSHF